jgi:hypothetical protein
VCFVYVSVSVYSITSGLLSKLSLLKSLIVNNTNTKHLFTGFIGLNLCVCF